MNKLEELEGECRLNIGGALDSFGHKCYKAGIREVVEWIEWHGSIMEFINMHHEEEWQAKLKEWGFK